VKVKQVMEMESLSKVVYEVRINDDQGILAAILVKLQAQAPARDTVLIALEEALSRPVPPHVVYHGDSAWLVSSFRLDSATDLQDALKVAEDHDEAWQEALAAAIGVEADRVKVKQVMEMESLSKVVYEVRVHADQGRLAFAMADLQVDSPSRAALLEAVSGASDVGAFPSAAGFDGASLALAVVAALLSCFCLVWLGHRRYKAGSPPAEADLEYAVGEPPAACVGKGGGDAARALEEASTVAPSDVGSTC